MPGWGVQNQYRSSPQYSSPVQIPPSTTSPTYRSSPSTDSPGTDLPQYSSPSTDLPLLSTAPQHSHPTLVQIPLRTTSHSTDFLHPYYKSSFYIKHTHQEVQNEGTSSPVCVMWLNREGIKCLLSVLAYSRSCTIDALGGFWTPQSPIIYASFAKLHIHSYLSKRWWDLSIVLFMVMLFVICANNFHIYEN